MVLPLQFSDQDTKLIEDYAKHCGVSVSEFIRNAVIERIEEEIDIQTYREAMAEYREDPVSFSREEVKTLIGL